jgi:hypothetical protein
VQIRIATIDDIPVLTGLWQERMIIIAQLDSRFVGAQRQREKWISGAVWSFDDDAQAIYLAQDDTGVIGYIIGILRNDNDGLLCGTITDIALDAHKYHGGLGRNLVAALRGWFAQGSAERILIKTPRQYAVEQAFWRALGAKECVDAQWETPPEYIWMTL